VRESKWHAIRYLLDANVIDTTGTPIPIRDRILSTLDDLAQTSAELECEPTLRDIERIVRAGTGADRRLATFAEAADLRAVTRSIAAETRGAPGRRLTAAQARRWFRRYWTFGVGSGAHVLVHALLETVRDTAERAPAGTHSPE